MDCTLTMTMDKLDTPAHDTREARLRIHGMGCSGCAASVQHALLSLLGVHSASVDLQSASARIEFNPASLGIGDLAAAIHEAGYEFAGELDS